MRWFVVCVVVVTVLEGCTRADRAPAGMTMNPGGGTPVRVLLFSATAGFRHDSIATAQTSLASMAASSADFTLTFSEDVGDLSAERLARVDVVFFAMTTGELPLSASEKDALLAFVRSGHGFIGTHSATDTLYDWPEYGELVGARFKEHPWTRTATVAVEDRMHPTTTGLDASFQIEDEFYAFRENPRPAVHVLLSLDAASVGATGDYPLAWTKTMSAGRVYYNALGHFPATWTDARFLRQIHAAILWAAGR